MSSTQFNKGIESTRFSGDLLIAISNDGADIANTNYWTSKAAQKGFCYLSGNAGTLRLLVPPATEKNLEDMKTGKSVSIEPSIIHRGNIDVVFEDGSQSPFFVSISPEMVDRKLVVGTKHTFAVWTQAGKAFTCLCRVRG